MFVVAWCAVGAAAVAELDLALVEVLLELGPLGARRRAVFVLGAYLAASGQVCLVVTNDVFLEHRHVAPRGAEVQVPEQGGADVDRQAAVDEVGGEQPAEVVGGETGLREGGVILGEFVAQSSQHVEHHGVAEHRSRWADEALEQERLGAAGLFVVGVEPGDEGDCGSVVGVSSDDLGHDVE